MKEFSPTYLYIKQHSITGKLYFGKTTLSHSRMLSYQGSGDYWRNHIKKHSKEYVKTIWYCLFTEKDECEKFALTFSEQQNIVESKEWANFKPENGLDGGQPKGFGIGRKQSQETKDLIRKIRKGSKQSQETKDKRAESLRGRIFTEDHLVKLRKPKPPRSLIHSLNQSKARKGIPWSDARRKAQENRVVLK